jgi:multidrug efflux pump subunit AcrA (membrane-fusion protein)
MEVIIFFIWPVAYETKVYIGLRQYITWNRRFILSITSAALLTTWFVLPFPHTYHFAAITVPYNLQAIYVPESGRIDEVYVTRGQKVEANSPIVRIDSFPLYNKFERAQIEEAIASKKTEIIAQDDALRAQYGQKRAEEIQVERTLQALENRQRLFNIQAVHAGYIVDWNELMRPGVYVKTGAMLGLIADNEDVDVICFVPERDREWLQVGTEAAFRPRHSTVTLNGKVIQTNSNRAITLLYPGLGSVHHGPLPVVQSEKQYILQESFYEARVKLDAKDTLRFGETGYIEVKGPWSSLLMRTGRYVLSVLFQESSL